MYEVDIKYASDKQLYVVGDTVSGTVELAIPKEIPLTNVAISFRCLGEVKWTEYAGSPYYMNGNVYNDRHYYHKEFLRFGVSDAKEVPHISHKDVSIPFSFDIPRDQGLPSTMTSDHGFIKYFVGVVIKSVDNREEPKKFSKEIIVHAPFEDKLMITVGGSAEKNVLLHNGKVIMHASIDRKGFARGETISVHVAVDNKTNAKVTPRVSLHQVQIFMSGARHKTIDTPISGEEPITGSEIEAHSEVEQLIQVPIPDQEALTIKSSLITVKYFVHVTLVIPHSFDLHVDLPVVLTKQSVIGI